MYKYHNKKRERNKYTEVLKKIWPNNQMSDFCREWLLDQGPNLFSIPLEYKQFISKLKSQYLDVTQDKNHFRNCIYGVFWEEKNAWRWIEDEIWDNTKSHSDNIRALLTIIILMRCWLFGFRLQQQLTSESNLFFVGWRKKYFWSFYISIFLKWIVCTQR